MSGYTLSKDRSYYATASCIKDDSGSFKPQYIILIVLGAVDLICLIVFYCLYTGATKEWEAECAKYGIDPNQNLAGTMSMGVATPQPQMMAPAQMSYQPPSKPPGF